MQIEKVVTDLECPFCKRSLATDYENMVQNHGENDFVDFIFCECGAEIEVDVETVRNMIMFARKED